MKFKYTDWRCKEMIANRKTKNFLMEMECAWSVSKEVHFVFIHILFIYLLYRRYSLPMCALCGVRHTLRQGAAHCNRVWSITSKSTNQTTDRPTDSNRHQPNSFPLIFTKCAQKEQNKKKMRKRMSENKTKTKSTICLSSKAKKGHTPNSKKWA